jgi:hypothetical protein
MRRLTIFWIAAIATVVYGAAALESSAAAAKNPARKDLPTLSADQIQAAIVGNTISGVEEGENYVEYLKEDGTIAGEAPSGRYTGRWRISGNQMCFQYDRDEEPDPDDVPLTPPKTVDKPEWDCNDVVLKGSEVHWKTSDAEETTSVLVQGNPNGL